MGLRLGLGMLHGLAFFEHMLSELMPVLELGPEVLRRFFSRPFPLAWPPLVIDPSTAYLRHGLIML